MRRRRENQRDLIRLAIAIFIPPLAVGLQVGLTLHFWLNILLPLMGWLPGVLHAAWVVLQFDDE